MRGRYTNYGYKNEEIQGEAFSRTLMLRVSVPFLFNCIKTAVLCEYECEIWEFNV